MLTLLRDYCCGVCVLLMCTGDIAFTYIQDLGKSCPARCRHDLNHHACIFPHTSTHWRLAVSIAKLQASGMMAALLQHRQHC
jgi:hypothetical protein